MRKIAALILLVLVPVLAMSQEHGHLRFFQKGKQIGDNSYERAADGSFKSSTQLDLGASKIQSTLTGHFKDGKLIDALADTVATDGSRKVTFAGGHVIISSGGQSASADFKDENGAVFPHLHPQLFDAGLLLAEKTIVANPGTTSSVLSVFDPEEGMSSPLKISVLPPRTLMIGEKSLTVKIFRVEFGSTNLDIAVSPENHVVGLNEAKTQVSAIADGWDGLFGG